MLFRSNVSESLVHIQWTKINRLLFDNVEDRFKWMGLLPPADTYHWTQTEQGSKKHLQLKDLNEAKNKYLKKLLNIRQCITSMRRSKTLRTESSFCRLWSWITDKKLDAGRAQKKVAWQQQTLPFLAKHQRNSMKQIQSFRLSSGSCCKKQVRRTKLKKLCEWTSGRNWYDQSYVKKNKIKIISLYTCD